MKKLYTAVLCVVLLSHALQATDLFLWKELPELPPLSGKSEQPGLAGPFAGVHNDALIIAGGANFPDGLPWQELADGSKPKKNYNRDIYLLQKNTPWIISDLKLPHGFSYGVTIPTSNGLICIGGEWREYNTEGVQKYISGKVFLIRHLGDGKLEIDENSFPDLPEAVYAMAGSRIGDYIYILGGNNGTKETRNFYRLNLKKRDGWVTLEPWPGKSRSHHIVVTQSDGRKDCLYLFSGRSKDPHLGWQLHTDGYKYDPDSESWTKVADVGTNMSNNHPVCVMAASAINLGANHIAVFGGASGHRFLKVEQEFPEQIKVLAQAGKTSEAKVLSEKMWSFYETHPGFSRDIFVYHTITDTWTKMGTVPETEIGGLPTGSHVTSVALYWDNKIVIPSGEVRPGVRTPKVWSATPVIRSEFGLINYIVVGIYLGLLVVMGFYFSRREKTTDDFFKAGGRVPWWAAGLSIFGTQLSAITFMAIPAKSFATDWTWITINLTIVAVAPFIVLIFLPFYRRLNVTTAYEYIEKRFNIVVRLTASAMFMIFQFARIGIVLYLPSIALSLVTGIDINICIVVMCLLSIFYTVLGGIEAVIWTDVIQVIVLLGGAIMVLLVIPGHVPGGLGGAIDLAVDSDKLRVFDFHFSLKSPTLWVLILGGIGANLISYGSDQSVIQRYLTTKDEKDAARSIWTNGILTIPASIIFFGLGTALFVFFKSNPETLAPNMQMTDAIFPWFIVTQLPVGIAGLLIAGIFAAAMSSLDSSMNSVATAYTTDFYRRFKPDAGDQKYLFVARMVTVLIGLSGMVFALAMASWDIDSLWSEFMKYIGLFGGGLGGLFILAIFTRRVNGKAAMAGLMSSSVIQYFLQVNEVVHGVMFAMTGLVACFLIGYLASLLLPGEDNDLAGLTVYSMRKTAK